MTDPDAMTDLPAGESVKVPVEDVRRLVLGVLEASSLFEADAVVVTEALLRAEARGLASDGLAMLPGIVSQIEDGGIDPRGRPLVMDDAAALRTIDGSSAVGAVAARAAVGWLAEAAAAHGAATALIRGSRDLGDPAGPAGELAEGGLLAICISAVYRGRPLIRAAAVSAESSADAGRRAVRWEGEPDPLLEVLIAGLAGGRPLSLKAEAPNPDIAEHVLLAFDPQQTGGPRLASRMAQLPGVAAVELRPPGDEPLSLARQTLTELNALAGQLRVDVSLG